MSRENLDPDEGPFVGALDRSCRGILIIRLFRALIDCERWCNLQDTCCSRGMLAVGITFGCSGG